MVLYEYVKEIVMKEDFKCRKYFLQTLEKVLIYTHQCKIYLTNAYEQCKL